ncbi:MAG: HAMP domain-containing histidine kinase [Chloroflexi bacterium]|nr:HAMP domain-containing histidine kinase [Chloroflexota bacterium]
MDKTVYPKINTVLDSLQLLQLQSTRLIINENAGHDDEPENLRSFNRGMNSPSLQETDLRFYGIMKSQSKIVIPSIANSHLLSGLDLKNSSAIFFPLNTEFGYVGCLWGCIEEMKFTDNLVDHFDSFCQWLQDIIGSSQRNEMGVEVIAEQYADFLDQQKTPALIVIFPDQVSISNPTFETLADKEKILQSIRKGLAGDRTFVDLVAQYRCTIRDITFPAEKKGKIFKFRSDTVGMPAISFDANELEYFRLMVQKISANLTLLESSDKLSFIQYNYKKKVDAQLDRMQKLIQYGRMHYSNFQHTREGSFKVVEVGALIKEVVFDLKSVAKKKGLDLQFNIEKIDGSSVQSGEVIGDHWLLTLMAFNLVQNAIRYSKQDGGSIEVELSFGIDRWQLAVRDHGIGISPLDVEKILQTTEFENPATDHNAVHGLDFVKHVVKVHKGEFGLESKLGSGSSFTVEMPYY